MVRLTASSPPGRLVLKREKRDEKAESNEPDIDYPVEQVAMVSESEAVSEASSRRTSQRWLTGSAQKGKYLGLRGQISRSNHPVQIPA